MNQDAPAHAAGVTSAAGQSRSTRFPSRFAAGLFLFAAAAAAAAAGEKGDIADFLGTWRGTSTCINRTVAPACKDETVVYEVRRGERPGAAILDAYKIVNGEKLPMGELEFVYSDKDGCWRSEFKTSRAHGIWCLAVEGRSMTGSLRVLPEDADVRKVQAVHE